MGLPGDPMKPKLLLTALTLAVFADPGTVRAGEAAAPTATQRWLGSVPVPEFRPAATPAAWAQQRAEIRATLQRLLGDFPPRTAPSRVRVMERRVQDGYILEKFAFEDGLGATVPGYLFLPTGLAAKAPAILYCHWHGGEWPVGKQEMLQTNATPVPPGPTLARLGYAILGIDAPGFGERNGQGPGGPQEKNGAAELTAAKFNLWAGRTLWGMTLRDDLTALDYLCSRPEIDPARIGVTGISMGSTRTWWLMALDDRLRAGVGVACLTRYEDLIAQEGLAAHGIYYFVPGLLRHFDTEAAVACIAPRPLLFLTGDRDPGSPVTGIQTIVAKVTPLYRLSGAEGHFQSVIYPDTGHIYLPAMWQRMVAWMDEYVKNPK